MAFRFTDQHAMSLVAPLLFPGEQVLFRARGVEKPWYSTVLWKLGGLFWRYWLVVATNQRLVLVRHRGLLGGYSARRSEPFGWTELDQVALGWGVFNKTLRLTSATAGLARTIVVPRFWLRGNFDAVVGAIGVWEENRQCSVTAPRMSASPPAPPAAGTRYDSAAVYGSSPSRCAAQPARSSTL